MGAYPINQYAPKYFAGVNQPPAGTVLYEDRPYEYIYGVTLTDLQILNQQSVAIQPDSDFLMRAWYLSLYTGQFQIQLIDSDGYQLSSGFINSGALSQSSADPTVFSPEHPFPASGKINLSIQDLSNSSNPLQLVFKGVKRFRVQGR